MCRLLALVRFTAISPSPAPLFPTMHVQFTALSLVYIRFVSQLTLFHWKHWVWALM